MYIERIDWFLIVFAPVLDQMSVRWLVLQFHTLDPISKCYSQVVGTPVSHSRSNIQILQSDGWYSCVTLQIQYSDVAVRWLVPQFHTLDPKSKCYSQVVGTPVSHSRSDVQCCSQAVSTAFSPLSDSAFKSQPENWLSGLTFLSTCFPVY